MQNAAYNGIDFILFSNPKFLVENLIAYLEVYSLIYIFKLIDFYRVNSKKIATFAMN